MNRKHVLAHRRFFQRYKNWTIDDWKCVIFSDKTKINKFNSDGSDGVGLEMENMSDLNMSIKP